MTKPSDPFMSGKRKADSLGRIAAQASRRKTDDGRFGGHRRPDDNESPSPSPTAENSRHAPRDDADPASAVESRTTLTNPTGRGASTGWTLCPLCGRHSQKRFALGRGIATHLHAVHTPWNPGKAERRKRQRLAEWQKQERKRRAGCQSDHSERVPSESKEVIVAVETREKWDPTPKERNDWCEEVLRIVGELEEKAQNADSANGDTQFVQPGRDRQGHESCKYVDSLPPFLQAAANGDLDTLQAMIEELIQQNAQNPEPAVRALLDTRDRHLSLAEHWAAGSGHLECLQYLFEIRDTYSAKGHNSNDKKMRRRDGKTCLHYAARNGQMRCLRYLVKERKQKVDERSGDGTTPFHLACFGGHVVAAQYLLDHGADPCAQNDWGCNAAHWVGLSSSGMLTRDEVWSMCQLLQSHGVSFVDRQKQGHSALHKAAQRRNFHVIDWMGDACGAALTAEEQKRAGQPDNGGHKPSEIWLSFGGSSEFAQRMRDEWGW